MKRRSFLKTMLAAVAFLSAGAGAFRTAIAKTCTQVTPRVATLPLVPKWNKVTDDIDMADFQRRAKEIEQSLFPVDLVFPRKGQIWEAKHDCEAQVCSYVLDAKQPLVWSSTRLRKGELVRITTLDDPKPMQIRFERVLVENPREVRELCMRTAPTLPMPGQHRNYFLEIFRLVEDV